MLVGYQVQKGTAADLEKRIEELRRRKEFEEAAVEAEKALVRYPNNFAIVYCCGEMYLLKGIDTHDLPSVEWAIELLSHAILLLPQNVDSEINEYTIQTAIVFFLFSRYYKTKTMHGYESVASNVLVAGVCKRIPGYEKDGGKWL